MSHWSLTGGGLYVPADVAPKPMPTAIDLFAGCGGFSLGFHQAGWNVVAAVEWDVDAAASYLVNLGGPSTVVHVGPGTKLGRKRTTGWRHDRAADVIPGAGTGWIFDEPDQEPVRHFWLCDVHDLTGETMLQTLGLDKGDLGCVMGGPPCQGFSKANANRSPTDTRNTLVFQFARLVLELWPTAMVMENVPGMLDMVTAEGIPVIDALARVLADGGFSTFDAMRRSLTSMAGSGGAVRKESALTAGEDAEPEYEQGVLL